MDVSFGEVNGEVPRDDEEAPESKPETAPAAADVDPLTYRREMRRLDRRAARLRAT